MLLSTGALLGSAGRTVHSYPHCWRCKKPVIFRATEQWFISVEHNNLRKKALDEITKVTWIPSWGKERIYGMVDSRPDWCISRQRSWGVPITLFRCKKCGETVTDKSIIDEVVKEVEKNGADVWFEKSADEFLPEGSTCTKCHSPEFEKELDILDVWFDSGVSHAAVVEADGRFPKSSDLYLEGSDQHRGWFQSSLLASVGTRDKAPYDAVLTHGFVVDGQGKKMSKSMGNVISPQQVTDRHGAEILRLWSASADYREDMRISKEILDRLVEAYRKIRNTCRFLLGNLHDFNITELKAENRESAIKDSLLEIDMYALSTLQNLIYRVTQSYEKFAFHEVFHAIYNFCVIDLSSFYLDVLKDRLYTFRAESDERRAAQWVLHKLLISLAKLMAPMLSFTSEEIWRSTPGVSGESIFLSAFPEVEHEYVDSGLEKRWSDLLRIREEVNKSLEIKRQEKYIGNSLEARIILYVDEKNEHILKNYLQFLPTLFIVSSAEVTRDAPPAESYTSPVLDGLSILIEKAKGEKCGRCWNWTVTTGNYNDFPELCERCYGVLKG
jgi:isoleucyl-tRNA synthetase